MNFLVPVLFIPSTSIVTCHLVTFSNISKRLIINLSQANSSPFALIVLSNFKAPTDSSKSSKVSDSSDTSFNEMINDYVRFPGSKNSYIHRQRNDAKSKVLGLRIFSFSTNDNQVAFIVSTAFISSTFNYFPQIIRMIQDVLLKYNC